MTVTDVIPFGRENAVSRRFLCEELQMTDRVVRREIATAREQGAFIINEQDGAGYYQSDETEVLARRYRQEMARLKAISKQMKPLRAELKRRGVEVDR